MTDREAASRLAHPAGRDRKACIECGASAVVGDLDNDLCNTCVRRHARGGPDYLTHLRRRDRELSKQESEARQLRSDVHTTGMLEGRCPVHPSEELWGCQGCAEISDEMRGK